MAICFENGYRGIVAVDVCERVFAHGFKTSRTMMFRLPGLEAIFSVADNKVIEDGSEQRVYRLLSCAKVAGSQICAFAAYSMVTNKQLYAGFQ